MARAEPERVTLCFNGDFNWFNVDDAGFRAINERVLRHDAILGNVEAELDSNSNDAGCGCAYPEQVDQGTVERSNQIHAALKRTAARHPDLLARLASAADGRALSRGRRAHRRRPRRRRVAGRLAIRSPARWMIPNSTTGAPTRSRRPTWTYSPARIPACRRREATITARRRSLPTTARPGCRTYRPPGLASSRGSPRRRRPHPRLYGAGAARHAHRRPGDPLRRRGVAETVPGELARGFARVAVVLQAHYLRPERPRRDLPDATDALPEFPLASDAAG